MKSLADIFVISLRIKTGNHRGQNQLVLIRERHWPTPSSASRGLVLGTPGLASRLAREKERHPDIGQDRVQAFIALACAGIGNMMEPCPHSEGDTLRGEVL